MKIGTNLSRQDCLENIREFVGGAFLSFEHGYNSGYYWGVSDTHIYLREGGKMELSALKVDQIRLVWHSIMEYAVYCMLNN